MGLKENVMSELAQEYIRSYGVDKAIPQFVADLMEHDPETLKRGYTRENAIIAAADAFDIDRENIERRLSQA